MEEVKRIRLKQEGGTYTTYGINDEHAREDIATLRERMDELDGNVTVKVTPAGGTFYRHGEPCTDNWCEKFVAGGNVAVRVETTDAARKFNLREKPVDGIYISSGQMQGWRIVAPDGYRIKGYRLSAVLRTEGQATITASTGQEIVVTQEHGASLAVTGLNAQETTFMTTDSSTIWGDRQIWILSFEIFAERTDRFALKGEVDEALQMAKDYADGLDAVTNSRIDALGSVYKVKGSSAWTVSDPTSALMLSMPGDVWNITESFTLSGKTYPAGTNVVCVASSMSTPDYNNRFDALAGEIDLSGFYTKTEVDAKLPTDVSRSQTDATFVSRNNQALFYLRSATSRLAGLMTAGDKVKMDANTLAGKGITDAYTKNEVDAALGGKQDIIDDLANIRSGAQAGSTAIQPDDEDYTELQGKVADLDDTAVKTGSYDATVAVGLADNLRGDTIMDAEFYKRKTGGTQSVGSGIAAIKEVRGKSIVWNQLVSNGDFSNNLTGWGIGGQTYTIENGVLTVQQSIAYGGISHVGIPLVDGHKIMLRVLFKANYKPIACGTRLANMGQGYINIGLSSFVADTWLNDATIGTVNGDVAFGIYFGALQDDSYISLKNVSIIDLTLMFGAGNEPSSVEEFEKMFPLDYYEYNAGEVIPFAGQNLVTTGKNQYNPATGKANLLGGQTYQLLGTYTSATIDEVAVTLDSNNCFTTTKDCVLEIIGGNDTDTFVGLYDGETNTYEPYEKHTLPLDPSQWRDKQGNLVFPYGGMHGVGTAYDYVKVDSDGYIRKAMRVFEQVDLGSLNYTLRQPVTEDYANCFYATLPIQAKNVGRTNLWKGFITPNGYIPEYAFAADYVKNKGLNTHNGGGNRLQIGDNSYNDAATFKAAMNGVPLIYELETPVEVELATPIYAKYLVDNDGTEEITPTNGATPYTAPANLSILYAMDARGEIKKLPKGYLSKESAENMLNAMKSAGVIQSYTMTYDAANARYQFTFVKAQQASTKASTNASTNEQNI